MVLQGQWFPILCVFLTVCGTTTVHASSDVDQTSQSHRIPEVGQAVMEWFQAEADHEFAEEEESDYEDYGGYTQDFDGHDFDESQGSDFTPDLDEEVLQVHPGLEYRDGGLFATEFIKEGSLLFHVPHAYLWTPESHFLHQDDNAHHSNSHSQSTQSLTKDELRFQHRHVRECNLAQRFAKEWAHTHSLRPHHPYLEFLAIHANETVPNLPAAWSSAGRDALKQVLGELFEQEPLIGRNRLDLSFDQACSQYTPQDDMDGVDKELLEKAYRIVASRSWYGTAVPLYDFINHNCALVNADDLREFTDQAKQEVYTIVAIGDIAEGEEVFDCYHDHTWFNSLNIFWQFGFVEPSDQVNFVFHIPQKEQSTQKSSYLSVEWLVSPPDAEQGETSPSVGIRIEYPNQHGYRRDIQLPTAKMTTSRVRTTFSPGQESVLDTVLAWFSSHVERLSQLQNDTGLTTVISTLSSREASLLKQLHSTVLKSFQSCLLILEEEMLGEANSASDDAHTAAQRMEL